MSVSLRKSFNTSNYLNEFARQKKLALCMWYKIIVALQHEDDVEIRLQKAAFTQKHDLIWRNKCFLCQLFMKDVDDYNAICTECPLERKYKGQVSFGCSLERQITSYARVTNPVAPKEERIAAAWEIVEAIKSV